MKKLINNVIFLSVILGSTIYGIYAIKNLLFEHQKPKKLKCEGMVLDTSKVYLVGDIKKKADYYNNPDTILLHSYINNLTNCDLGCLYYSNNNWNFKLSHSILFPNNGIIANNPLLPYCYYMKKGYFNDELLYFHPGENITTSQLVEGVYFNTTYGYSKDLIQLKLSHFAENSILFFPTEGIGISYPIFLDTTKIELIFGENIDIDTNLSINKAYSFNFHSQQSEEKFIMKCIGNSDEIIVSNSNNNQQYFSTSEKLFIFKDILFSIKPTLSTPFKLLVVCYTLILILFQAMHFNNLIRIKNPFAYSIKSMQLIFNSIIFLSFPLLFIAQEYNTTRYMVIFWGVLLNLNYNKLANLIDRISIYITNRCKSMQIRFDLIILIIVSGIIFLALIFTRNEKLFGIPILHITKIILLLIILLLQLWENNIENAFKNLKRQNFIKIIFVFFEVIVLLCISFIIWLITNDFGSFIYATLSLLIIEFFKSNKKKFSFLFLFFVCIFSFTLLSLYISPLMMKENRKLYRLNSWINTPEHYDYAYEMDRETVSQHYVLLKSIIDNPKYNGNKTFIPSNWRTVFFSDYAVLWSLKIGGWIFGILLFVCLFYLLYHFIRIICFAIYVFKIDENQVFYFSPTQSKLYLFLLTITIVQFFYPIISNLLGVFLTGQSVPLLCISIVEIFFVIIVLTSIYYIYNKKNYYKNLSEFDTKELLYYSDVKKKINFFTFSIILLIGAYILLNILRIHKKNDSIQYQINRVNQKEQFAINPIDKNAIIEKAKSIAFNKSLYQLHYKEKDSLKNLASLFKYNKPYSKKYPNKNYYQFSVSEILYKTNYDSIRILKRFILDTSCYYIKKYINGNEHKMISNKYYAGFPFNSNTINLQLQIELTKMLEAFINKTNRKNIGSILVVDNANGNILTSASYPLIYNYTESYIQSINRTKDNETNYIYNDEYINVAEANILPGSLVKPIIAYLALVLIPAVEMDVVGKINFYDFIRLSDANYSAYLFKSLLQNPIVLDKMLKSDFNMSLYPEGGLSFADANIEAKYFNKPLDRMNKIYRLAIGQNHKLPFLSIVQCYSRMVSGQKINLSYYEKSSINEPLSINTEKQIRLLQILNAPFNGTAKRVKIALEKHGINTIGYICKTGTAQHSSGKYNASSGFIIANKDFTIGIQLAGQVPFNDEHRAAKDLFIELIPVLIKYEILKPIITSY